MWELEKSNDVVNYYTKISAKETKNKQNSLLTILCENRSCLIKNKNKKQNKTNKKQQQKKSVKKLSKLATEVIVVMISWYHGTVNVGNISKSKHVKKK